MNIITVKDYQEMSARAGELLIEKVNTDRKTVLGLATGSTPEGMYAYLAKKYNEGNVSFSDVQTFNLDEYVGLDEENPNSYKYYMKHHLFNHIDLPVQNAHLPNGTAADLAGECNAYEKKIEEVGKIDLQVLGIKKIEEVGKIDLQVLGIDRKSTRLNSSHVAISYAVFCLKKKREINTRTSRRTR